MQINNSSSPNFKALIIEPGAKNALRTCNMSQLTKINDAGNLLKDTKFYNLRIDETLKCHLELAKDKVQDFFFGVFKPVKYFKNVKQGKDNNIILFDNMYGVAKLNLEGKPGFNVWNVLGAKVGVDDIDGVAKVVKELDVASEASSKAQALAIKLQEEIDVKVDDLLNKFSK